MTNKNIIITGATGNLGAATVEKFLKEEYSVSALVSHGKKLASRNLLYSYQADLIKDIEATSAVEKIISDRKTIHGAVLTVGGYAPGTIESTTSDDINKMIDLNFQTAYNIVKPIIKHFKNEKYGRLVLVGAKPALEPESGKTAVGYALSKSLIFKLGEIINADVADLDIKASVIVPNIIDTPANRAAMPDADFSKWLSPDAIANVIYNFIVGNGNESIIKLY